MVAPAAVRCTPRPLSLPAMIGLAFAVALLAWRTIETPFDAASMIRVCVGAVAIAAVVLSRRRSLAQQAALFVGLEIIGGIAAFAIVDVPLVAAHRAQINALAVSLYADVHRAH